MVSTICIDPTLAEKLRPGVSLTVQKEDNSLSHHIIYNPREGAERWQFMQASVNVCFDIMRVFDDGWSFLFVRDVKILYELRGKKFDSLTELAQMVLGDAAIEKYKCLSVQIKAHLTSYRLAKIDIGRYAEVSLIPHDLHYDFYKERAKLILELYRRHCEDNCVEVDAFYKAFYEHARILHAISSHSLKIDTKVLEHHTGHHVKMINKCLYPDDNVWLRFHIVGAKTGRLAFKKGTINIYGWPKELRSCIVADPQCNIVEFDFKAAQPRLAIFATSDEKFKDRFRDIKDVYSVFPGERKKNKIDFLAWMYGTNKNEMFEREAPAIQQFRDELYVQARNNGKVINKFGRVLFWSGEEKNVVLQNYVTSLEVDAILLIMNQVHKRLCMSKSRILFPFHDALVCMIHDDEQDLVIQIKELMEETLKLQFDSLFPVEIKQGKNYGEMK